MRMPWHLGIMSPRERWFYALDDKKDLGCRTIHTKPLV